jgi:hypothetical protein
MTSRSRAIGCGANSKSYLRPCSECYLLPDIDEDLPALDALQFENPALEPGIVLQIFAYFIFVVGIDD